MTTPSLSRRAWLTGAALTVGGAAAGALPTPPRPGPGTGPRPNILWLVSEDNNPYVGAYGDTLAHTPTIDALARKGVLYRNAYSTGPVCAISRFAILTGMYAETCGPAQHMRARAHLPAELKTYPEYLREAGYYCTNNAKTDYNCDVDPKRIWNESSPRAQWYNRPEGTPFMAVYNHGTTHESQLFWTTPGRVTPDMVRVPRYLPDSPAVRGDIASYYNLMEKMDGQLAERLRQIEERGAADDTIVFYYSDNGGVLPRSKHYSCDEGYRTCLVIYVPPKWRHLAPAAPGSVIDTPVSFIDLAPTLLSLVGQATPDHMQGRALMGAHAGRAEAYAFGGRDRMDEHYDFCRTVTDGRYRLIRNYLRDRPGAVHDAFAWQMKSYQDWERRHLDGTLDADRDRFFGLRPFEQFYDLHTDPDGVRDVIDDRRHAARVATMRRALDAHMLRVNDNGFIPEGAAAEGYYPSRDSQAYPLARVMTLAALAAQRVPHNVPALRTALGDANEIVRYWGAIGLRFLGKEAIAALPAIRQVMVADPSPHVRIAAAGCTAAMGEGEAAAHRLATFVVADANAKPVRLQALDTLTYLGPAAAAALPQIRAAATEADSDIKVSARYLAARIDGSYTPASPIFAAQPIGEGNKAILPPPAL
ncbi:sulfatase-like hydrolase/transferase [Sphingomonas sp. RP10(2022)]|uniref:Sulfatase-like hydrolase/transferase n=1 Tax=Sphingomonas liriopis TaxID=2949094 RepID=A0A9X2HQG2_9SPHN|nr:sulfatase-like hydrolase/transferase [Sphingomonas liriopis]MCP3733529.1 sulfatase-like hydrolase/transferase [Sphingomonas liriopis]